MKPLHRLLCPLLAAALFALAACAPVAEEPVLRVIATDPGSDAVLGAQQRFHIQFAVTGKMPLTVTVDPYFQHAALSANLGTSAPVTLPAGGGTAVAHVFFWGDYATRVDEIRLVARVPKQNEVRAELSLPVKLSWVARDVPPHDAAAWVANAQKNAAVQPLDAIDERSRWLAFGAVIVAITVAGFGSRWLRKRWRARKQPD